jgi:hypothetical protein
MKVIRRSRCASVAGMVAVVLSVLAFCPCAPLMAAPAGEADHGCCAGKAALTVSPAPASCCMTDARDPQLGDVRPPALPAPVPVRATLDSVVATPSLPSLASAALAPLPPSSPPLVLRV